jgi:maltooligosyltrehalose trehalohydrolase
VTRDPLVVWAPRPGRVELIVYPSGPGGRAERRPMMPLGDGHVAAEAPRFDVDYALSLDGGPPRPDPRADLQPHGVHGPSRRIDHRSFTWSAPAFRAAPLRDAVIYELHVGTFSPEGTFAGAMARLDHLVELGVTHVELMPVATFPGARGWGYDGVALYAPHPAYGTPDDLRRLVDACHRRGLAALLDVVYNHLGPDGNYLGEYGPYFTDRVKTPWGAAVNLDGAGADETRAFLIDNARHWLRDYRFDGLRLDAIDTLHDESAHHFLEELAAAVDALEAELGRPLVLIGESDRNDPRDTRPRDAGGLGLDAQWSDGFHHALHTALTGERTGYYVDFGGLSCVARALTRGFVHDGQRSAYRGRRFGRPLDSADGARLLGYLQTHDQVGNRARGDRIGHLTTPGRVRIGAALVLTSPFVPMLFQGEEWGASTPFQYFTDHQSPELAEAVRTGRRREFAAFGWRPDDIPDPQARSTFDASVLRWDERERGEHRELLAWHRALIALRHRRPALRDGRLDRVDVTVDEHTIVVRRGEIAVAANLGTSVVTIPSPRGVRVLAYPETDEGPTAVLPPDGCAVWDATP